MSILVGTASWTDPTLIKCRRFYPPGCAGAEARLRHYASIFPIVEVDSSYYAMPNAAHSVLWAQRTPPGFVFNIKAFRLFTGHHTAREMFPADMQPHLPQNGKASLYYKDLAGELQQELWCRYFEAVEPLRVSGKLGAVHFQFAPWVICNPHGIRHVEHCADIMSAMDGYTMAVEFRNHTWFDNKRRDSTLAMERERGLVNVVVDEPQGSGNSIPAIWETTHPGLALIRLHGRNHETWNIKGAVASSSRFNYEYNDDELGPLARQIIDISKAVDMTHVVFNTNYEDQGQRNAMKLMGFLGRG